MQLPRRQVNGYQIWILSYECCHLKMSYKSSSSTWLTAGQGLALSQMHLVAEAALCLLLELQPLQT